MLSFMDQRIVQAKELLGASELSFDLTGVTLTIDDKTLFLPIEAIRTLSAIVGEHEQDVVRELRQRMQSAADQSNAPA